MVARRVVLGVVAVAQLGGGAPPDPITPKPPPPSPVLAVLDLSTSARRLDTGSGGVSSFELWDSMTVSRAQLFVRAAASFGLGPDDDVVELGHVDRARGFTYSGHQLRSHHIPIEGAAYSVIERYGRVIGGGGRLVTKLALPTAPTIDAAAALITAEAATGGTGFAWQSDPSLAPPTATLVYDSPDLGATVPFALAYRFDLAVAAPAPASWRVHVDARTGAVIDAHPTSSRADTPADGVDAFGHAQSFSTEPSPTDPSKYRLQEHQHRAIATLDGSGATPIDFVDADNHWYEQPLRDAVSAHWGAEKVWDYLLALREVGGLGGLGAIAAHPYRLILESSKTCDTHWNDLLAEIELCGAASPPTGPDIDLETIAHEVGHGERFFSAQGDFEPFGESNGLNEGFADILATSVQAKNGDGSDWLLFDQSRSGQVRDLADPESRQLPATYGGLYWKTEEHAEGSVLGHWFYLLAVGGPGFTGIGRARAEKIALTTGFDVLPASADFAMARTMTLLVAGEIDGADAVAAVAAAWDAVGVKDPAAQVPAKTRPAPGETMVAPWPATLAVAVTPCTDPKCDPEVEWKIEASLDPTFNGATNVKVGPPVAGWVSGTDDLFHGAVYYWRAKARHLHGGWEPTWRFQQAFQTSQQHPVGVTPADDATDVDPWPVKVTWKAVPGARGYRVEVASDAAFHDHQDQDYGPSTLSSAELHGKAGAPMFVQVIAKGPNLDTGDPSTMYDGAGAVLDNPSDVDYPWSVEVSSSFTGDVRKPAVTAPDDGKQALAFATKLSWKANGADHYEVAVASTAAGLTTATLQRADHASLTVADDPSKTWVWHVRGIGTLGDPGEWSDARSFDADDAAVTLTKPGEGAAVYPWPVSFAWKSVAGAEHYDFQVTAPDDAAFQTLIYDRSFDGDRLAFDGMARPYHGTMRWRMRAVHDGVEPGGWTERAYTYDDASTPHPIVPAANATIEPSYPQFAWSPVERAVRMEIEIRDADDGSLVQDLQSDSPLGYELHDVLPAPANDEWRVRAIGPADRLGRWSPYSPFKVSVKPCNGTTQAGDIAIDMNVYSLGVDHGTFAFKYQTYEAADEIEVRYEDQTLLDVCDSTGSDHSIWKTVPLTFSGKSTSVTVIVHPNCDPSSASPGTKWAYQVICPKTP